MGITRDRHAAAQSPVPLIGIVGPASEGAGHIKVRMMSMGVPHRALPGTASIALSVAARIEGTVVAKYAGTEHPLVVHHPGGQMHSDAKVDLVDGNWQAGLVTLKRTQRTLFRGEVMVPQLQLGAVPT